MKGTLLLLALLVIGELDFHTTEACFPFFDGFSAVVSGNRLWLNHVLHTFNGTEEEKAAFEKVQDCYSEGGLKAKFLEPQIMEAMLFSEECMKYYSSEAIAHLKNLFAR